MPTRDGLLPSQWAGDDGRRSCRLPVPHRILFAVLAALIPAGAALLARAPLTGGRPLAAPLGWLMVAAATLAWLVLASRAWRESATLTPEELVTRGVLRTRRLPLAAVASVRFRGRGTLTLAVAVPGPGRGRHGGGRNTPAARHSSGVRLRPAPIPAVRLGTASLTGRRTRADAFADAVARAAGLPPLPPRAGSISRRSARIRVAAALALIAVGAGLGQASPALAGPARSMGHLLGEWLGVYAAVFLLFPAAAATLDRRLGSLPRPLAPPAPPGLPAVDGHPAEGASLRLL